jgi:hypothetical protein
MGQRAAARASVKQLESVDQAVLQLRQTQDLAITAASDLLKVTNRSSLWRSVTRVRDFVCVVTNRGVSGRFVTLSMRWGGHGTDYGVRTCSPAQPVTGLARLHRLDRLPQWAGSPIWTFG